MKVKEIIKKLSQFDPELEVVFADMISVENIENVTSQNVEYVVVSDGNIETQTSNAIDYLVNKGFSEDDLYNARQVMQYDDEEFLEYLQDFINNAENKLLITAYVSCEETGEIETPYRLHIEQGGEIKEYEHYKTEVLAEERAEYINRLCTSDWNML